MNCEIPNKRKCSDYGKTLTLENRIFSRVPLTCDVISRRCMCSQWYEDKCTATLEYHVADT